MHDLRHDAARRLIVAGIPVAVAASIIGNSRSSAGKALRAFDGRRSPSGRRGGLGGGSMKSKKHDLAGSLAGFRHLQDATEKLIDIALSAFKTAN